MRKRLGLIIAAVGLTALAAGAVPAFTADNGTVTLTVTAAAPASPCIEFATPPGTQVGFGTHPFSTAAQVSTGLGDVAPRFSNCATVSESFLISGTDATSSATTWTLAGGVGNPCPTQGVYRLFYNTDNFGSWPITKTNALLQNLSNQATTFAAGEAHNLGIELAMPCQGTGGGGQTFSLSVNLVAQIA